MSQSLGVALAQVGRFLPSGFELPPLPYLAGVLAATAIVAAVLYRLRPTATQETVLAFVPWIVSGAGLYALFQAGATAGPLAPLLSSPTVYLTTFLLAGTTWALADWQGPTTRFVTAVLLLVGLGTMSAVLGMTVAWAMMTGTPLTPAWPGVALVVAGAVASVAWVTFDAVATDAATTVNVAGPIVVFGHVLDGISTAVGINRLGFGEQTPLSALLLEIGESVFVVPVLGGGWLFVLVKLVLALVVVGLLAGHVRERRGEGLLTMAAVAAVGLGPGAHNLILFTIASP